MTQTVVEITNSSQQAQFPEEQKVSVPLQDVQILEDHVRCTIAGGVEKIISLDDFRNILNSAIGIAEDTKMDGFNLPSNVFYFAKSGTDIRISCYYPSRVSGITHFTKKMDIVLPNIIISHQLHKAGEKTWHVAGSRYLCTDLSPSRLPRDFINSIDHSKRIFLLPLPNTYAEGNMCYGSNSMPSTFTENNLRGLDWYYQYLFESPFNDDLGIKATGHLESVKDWLRRLATLAKEDKPFPYEKLIGYTSNN